VQGAKADPYSPTKHSIAWMIEAIEAHDDGMGSTRSVDVGKPQALSKRQCKFIHSILERLRSWVIIGSPSITPFFLFLPLSSCLFSSSALAFN
jgi:hypothetical protein